MVEDDGEIRITGQDADVLLDQPAQPPPGIRLLGCDDASDADKALGRVTDQLPKQVFFGGNMGIKAATLEVEGSGDVTYRGGVIAAGGEQPLGRGEDIVATRAVTDKRTLVSHGSSVGRSLTPVKIGWWGRSLLSAPLPARRPSGQTGVRHAVVVGDVRLEVEHRRAVHGVEATHPDHSALDALHCNNRDRDRVGPVLGT